MPVLLLPEPFDPAEVLKTHEQTLKPGSFGATATFVGTMRDFNEGDAVTGMTLEHYPEMTAKQLNDIIEVTAGKWPIMDALIAHRYGDIHPGDPIVLTAVWSAHRAAAFDACRYLMEALKKDATFWKKEILADNSERWVEKNTPGYSE